jgi:CheY-like chemotaxis protein
MSLEGLAILVLEDEPVIALTVEDLLLDAGSEPVIVTSLASADAVLGRRAFDLALLDVNIGGARSYALAAKLKSRGIPFAFATGYGDALHGEECAGVPTVTKPYNLADIEGALAAVRA